MLTNVQVNPSRRIFFYHLLHNPYFWGHSARDYNNTNSKNGQKTGAWAYDPAFPAPEDVHIFYNVNDPVYVGELATRIRAELHRRSSTIQGATRPQQSRKFSGLLLCGYCGRTMVYGDNAYRCESRWKARTEPKCDRFRQIKELKAQAWVSARLHEMLEHDMPDLLARGDDKPDLNKRIDTLKQEVDDLQAQARMLVNKQAQAHSALSSIYDEQLQSIGERMDILRQTLTQTEREARAQDTSAAKAAFHELPTRIDDMWEWNSTAINQLLHRLMGRRRLVVKDGEIVSTQDAPMHPKRKERKRGNLDNGHHSIIE